MSASSSKLAIVNKARLLDGLRIIITLLHIAVAISCGYTATLIVISIHTCMQSMKGPIMRYEYNRYIEYCTLM